MILLTRAIDDSERMAHELAPLPCFIEPMLSIKKLSPDIKNEGQTFVVTSKNAKDYIPTGARSVSIPEHGKKVSEIIDHITTNAKPGERITYLRGSEITIDLTKILIEAGFNADEIIVYETIYASELSPNLISNLDNIKIACFFSSNSAITFLALASKYNLLDRLKNIIFIGLSDKVAEVAKGYFWKRIDTAAEPSENSLLEKLRELY